MAKNDVRMTRLQWAFSLLVLAGCGGGGGSTGGDSGSAAGGTVTQTESQPAPAATGGPALTLQRVATGLSSPLFLTAPKADTRLFIVERGGSIRIVRDGRLLPVPFLDIRSRTTTEGERGLLSMAFDPQYQTNGFFYLYFTELNGDIAIERYSVLSANPDAADPLSALRIMSIPHPVFSNHNGGLLNFGPDGFLYIGTGDGGSAFDPNGNAQNTSVLLGKLLRIDVSGSTAGRPYSIPASNPFVAQAMKRPEIWAYGLRNPWRYAFDAVSNLLYIADVGQSAREELNVAGIDQAGLNYGWSRMEGSACVSGGSCDSQGLVLPALEYAHDSNSNNACSIIGGAVYRGAAIPELRGAYLYSDLCAGWLKGFRYTNGVATDRVDFGKMGAGTILSFGEDAQHELYLLSAEGNVYRVVRG
jgi:glucose/arabinose dehydrogenase